MTQQQFIETFNGADQLKRAAMFPTMGLQKSDAHLVLPVKPGLPYKEIHIVGYAKVRAALWYVVMTDGTRVPIKAFKLHNSGVDTYNEWVRVAPSKAIAEAVRERMISAFDGVVLPAERNN
jgi:hypothetical protein